MSSILSPDPIPPSSGSHLASYRPQPNRISDFVPASFGQTSALIHRELLEISSIRSPQDAIEQLLETPGQVLRKGGGRGQTSVIDWNGRTLFRKVYTPAGTLQAVLNALRRSRVHRELYSNVRVSEVGIATATVVAAVRRRGFLADVQAIFTEPAPGEDVLHLLKHILQTRTERSDFLQLLGAYIALLHHKKIAHRHIHCRHIFWDREYGFSLIDLDGAWIAPWEWLMIPSRRRNLHDMENHLRKAVSAVEIDIFHKAYQTAATKS